MEKKDDVKRAYSLLSWASVDAFDKIPLENVLPEFDRVQEEGLALISSDELKLEFRQTVAQDKMITLCYRNAPYEDVEKAYHHVLELGCVDIERELAVEACLVQYCYYTAKLFDVALAHLLKMQTKLEDASAEYRSLYLPFVERYMLKIQDKKSD